MKKYTFNLAISFDQLFNTFFCGDPDTCISSRLAYNYPDSWMRKTVDWIFLKLFNDKDHCLVSLGNEMNDYFNRDSLFK